MWTSHGPPELNLWPRMRRLLNNSDETGASGKQVVPLRKRQFYPGESRLARIYILSPGFRRTGHRIEDLKGSDSLMELVRSAHRLDLRDSDMLRRQMDVLHQVTRLVRLKRIAYRAGMPDPRRISEAILKDLADDRITRRRSAIPRLSMT